jgi:methionine biosynthesis protein MetW
VSAATQSRTSARAARPLRRDLELIAEMIPAGTRVLDIGCGDGALLEYLVHEQGVDGRGIELSQAGVNACVARGLSVIQGDADADLKDYPSDAFDVAVLSQTLQATRAPRTVLEELVRIGRRAIVSFPNFGHWRVRWRLLFDGRMPTTPSLPDAWYDTPNIHLCTILDFEDLAAELGLTIERALVLDSYGTAKALGSMRLANWFGEQCIVLLRRG